MFKKKPQIKPAAPLRSSDRRKLADSIIQEYNLQHQSPNETEEQKAESTAARTALRSSLLPENVQTARFTTTHGPELKQVSGTVYIGAQDGNDLRVLWWQINGRMFPSLYTIWKHPDIVALLLTPGVVIDKMYGGADLMTPGLVGPPFPEGATKDAIVAVADYENPTVPLAVGVCEINIAILEQVRGAKGMAVQNLHWAGDELYKYSPSDRPAPPIPVQIEGWDRTLHEQDVVNGAAGLDIDDDAEEGGVAVEPRAQQDEKARTVEVDEGHDDNQNPAPAPTQQEIDLAFRNAFLFGIHHHKHSHSGPHHGLVFPLGQSFVMSNLIQPFLPAFTPEQTQQLQIKKTSWKNIKKFIKTLDKERIIRSKEKDGHETVILDIDFEDAAINSFTPYRLPKKQTLNGTSQGRGDKATEQIDGGDDAVGQKLEVKTILKPTAKLSPLFPESGKSQYTAADVREAVTAYVESENLISGDNKRMVKLNPALANAVFDGSGALDNEVIAKGAAPRDALIDRVLHSMAPSYVIVRNGVEASKARSGAAPKIQIVLETRSGNKTVTKVSGLEAYFIRPRPLADELRKVCAGSTSVEPLAGATKKNEKPIEEVMIQGPQKEAVTKALKSRGVNPKWIEVIDKTKKKK